MSKPWRLEVAAKQTKSVLHGLRKNQDIQPTQVGLVCVDTVYHRRFHVKLTI